MYPKLQRNALVKYRRYHRSLALVREYRLLGRCRLGLRPTLALNRRIFDLLRRCAGTARRCRDALRLRRECEVHMKPSGGCLCTARSTN
jgi:hypothetical protein